MTNLKSRLTQSWLRLVLCLLIVGAAAVALAKIAVAVAMDEGDRVEARCEPPFLLLGEEFDGVIPPALPPSWSSTTWATSDSGVPTPTPIHCLMPHS